MNFSHIFWMNRKNWIRVLVALLTLGLLFPIPTTCSNILLMPFSFRSHVAEISAIGSNLKEKGHNVFLMLSGSYPHLDEAGEKFHLIIHSVKHPDFYSKGEDGNSWMETAMKTTPIEEFRIDIDGFVEMCTNPLEDETLPEKIGQFKFDLAIVDGFPGSRCLYAIAYKIGIPYVTLTTQYEPWVWRNPALPSFVPFPLAALYTERMNLMERIQNLFTLVDWTAWPRVPYMEDDFLKPYLPDDSGMTFSKLAARSLLFLIDTDVAIDFARPTMANEVYIGGLSTRPARPLSPDLEEFVSGAVNGFIVVSFGSSGILDDEHSFEVLAKAFAVLEQKIVWKYSNDLPKHTEVPSNVKTLKWLPQNDLLGHRNCRLFVTHCGANGQFEALYHGVPMLGIPVFADQPYNARRMQYFGYGLFVELSHVTTESLLTAILEIIGNNTYAENIRKGSKIFRDRPQGPIERAVWWIEHVLRHGGKHLHSIALDMPWHEYLMLDILLVVVILPVIILTSLMSCCMAWAILRRRKSPEKLKMT